MTSLNSTVQDDFEPEDDFEAEEPSTIQKGLAKLPKTPESLGDVFRDIKSGAAALEQHASGLKKGISSGMTFGLTENVPGNTPEEGEEAGFAAGKVGGSLIPISQLFHTFELPLVNMAKKSPIFQKQLSAFARLTAAGATGATDKGLETLAKGEMPSTSDMVEHGVEWVALDAAIQGLGLGGRFAAALLKKTQGTGESANRIISEIISDLKESGVYNGSAEKVAIKALSILERDPEVATKALKMPEVAEPALESVSKFPRPVAQDSTLDLTTKKIEPKIMDRINGESSNIAEPIKPTELDAQAVLKDINKSNIDERINSLGDKAGNQQSLGESIKRDVESNQRAAEELYRPFYENVKEQSQYINHTPTRSIRVASNLLEELESLSTRPSGYSTVIKALETALEDLGAVIERNENGRYNGIYSTAEGGSPLSHHIDLAKRLNEIVNYDVLDKSIKDRLKPLVRSVKAEIREGLATNPELLQEFNQAESLFGETANLYNRENIRSIRSAESGEKIAKLIKSPTALRDLKPVLSKNQLAQVERDIIDHINTLSHEKAVEAVREFGPQLSQEAQQVAKEVVQSKLPMGKRSQVAKIQKDVFNDMSKSLASGRRPEKALKLWRTKEGQNIIRDGLKNSPNRREILNYLREQSLHDFSKSVIGKDGKIDFKTLKSFLKDPMMVENLRLTGGEDAVKFFNELEGMATQLNRNISLIEKIPTTEASKASRGKDLIKRTGAANKEKRILEAQEPKESVAGRGAIQEDVARTKERAAADFGRGKQLLKEGARRERPIEIGIKEFLANLGVPAKTIIGLLGAYKYGAAKFVGGYYGGKAVYKLATSHKARRAFRRATKINIDTVRFFKALDEFNDAMDEGEED